MSKASATTPTSDPRVFDLPGFCAWAHIGRTRAFEEIAKGRLRARRIGRKSLIALEDAEAWLNALPTSRAA